jgi:hypothetical protein
LRVFLAAAVEHLRVLPRDVAQGWTIGRRLSHCDVTIYHYFTVQMADPRLPADIKSKVRAAAATAADTRFRSWRDVTFHQAAAALEKFPHIRRIVGQVAAHPGTHYLCASVTPTPRLLTRVLQLLQRGTRVSPLAWLPASRFRHAVCFQNQHSRQ